MRVLVTGGMGFVGSHLVKRLYSDGHTVDIVDDLSTGNPEVLCKLNVRESFPGLLYKEQDRDFIRFFKDDFAGNILNAVAKGLYDTIFHCAALPSVTFSVNNPAETSEVNLNNTVKLFDAARLGKTRIVFSSSSSVYGDAEILPTTEDCQKNPLSPYAWQKSACEDAAKVFCKLYKDSDIICLRYFNIFGPEQLGNSAYSTVIAAWCYSAKNNLECRFDGDGTQTRDMCYVDNIVEANVLAMNKAGSWNGQVFNIGCGESISNTDIITYFIDNFDAKVKSAPRRHGDITHSSADISRARKELGYEPKVRFWEGLEKTVKWWGLK